jgi:hypothetical protein
MRCWVLLNWAFLGIVGVRNWNWNWVYKDKFISVVLPFEVRIFQHFYIFDFGVVPA